MAPACDMKLSQNTPDARFSPPLFQTLLNFKQNKRTGKEGEWEEREKWARGARGMCNNITISFIHSFCPCASPQEHSSLNLALCQLTRVKAFLLSLSTSSDLDWTNCSFNEASGVWLLHVPSFFGIVEQLTAVFVDNYLLIWSKASVGHPRHS